jgi:hypothetical protein
MSVYRRTGKERPAVIYAWRLPLGAENANAGAGHRDLGYLFKLRQSPNLKKLIGQIFNQEEWAEAGQGWKGGIDELRLSGWTEPGGLVVLRRPLPGQPAAEAKRI